jgi:hypothetical protein
MVVTDAIVRASVHSSDTNSNGLASAGLFGFDPCVRLARTPITTNLVPTNVKQKRSLSFLRSAEKRQRGLSGTLILRIQWAVHA